MFIKVMIRVMTRVCFFMVCGSFSKVIFAGYSVMFVLAASYKGIHTFWWPLKNTEHPHGKRKKESSMKTNIS